MPKAIILLADGTGNSSSSFTKTNVWRLYQALDLTPSAQQIAYYHDGVGTASFKLLAILGGAFGWGLKRNVIDLYVFLCRNYEPGDEIYGFGFSRGAFTIRILIGIVARFGLRRAADSTALRRAALDVYRHSRELFEDRRLVSALRRVRGPLVKLWRHVFRVKEVPKDVEVPMIAFVGVWDTVAAYGMPIVELTRGIDRLIWPLDLPNYRLSLKVRRARHALALDDERQTFHPLLWDEIYEDSLVAQQPALANRLRQVWFAGMHADIGGGYADDALSYVALNWMMDEAEVRLNGTGITPLHYIAATRQEIRDQVEVSAPMHDSRRGLTGYYRYQPRKIGVFLEPPDLTTLILQDPDFKGRGFRTSVKIHESVFDRIKNGPDGYAPIVLPDQYQAVDQSGKIGAPSINALARAACEERVWNWVWRRPAVYFLTVLSSLALALVPPSLPSTSCAAPHCLLAPVISFVGAFLPSFVAPLIDSYAEHPGCFLVLAFVLALFMALGSKLQIRIDDRMRELWNQSMTGGTAAAPGGPQPQPRGVIFTLRNGCIYQSFFIYLKLWISPWAFGLAMIAASLLVLVAAPVNRSMIAIAKENGWFCNETKAHPSKLFETRSLCTRIDMTGLATKGRVTNQLVEGELYRIKLTVEAVDQVAESKLPTRNGEWFDSPIDTNPLGFTTKRMRWWVGPSALLMRRSFSGRWFQPIIQVIGPDGTYSQLLDLHLIDLWPVSADGKSHATYAAEFTAEKTGDLYIYVNDAMVAFPQWKKVYAWLKASFPRWPRAFDWLDPGYFYSNNLGSAAVEVEWVETVPHTVGSQAQP